MFKDGTVREGVPGELNLVTFGALGGAMASAVAVAVVRLGRRIDHLEARPETLAR